MFVGKARSQPYLEHLKGASLWYSLALQASIRLGWKSLPWKNTLAYYEHLNFKVNKTFYNIGPRGQCYKLFTAVSYEFS